jgi:hypothetical protein
VWALGVIAAFAAYLRLARTRAVNSDGAGNALQAWDMLHGNVLLHGWSLSDVSFYTTELPQYMLVEAWRGLNADVVHVAAGMTYTLVVLLGYLVGLARRSASRRPPRSTSSSPLGWRPGICAPACPATGSRTWSR